MLYGAREVSYMKDTDELCITLDTELPPCDGEVTIINEKGICDVWISNVRKYFSEYVLENINRKDVMVSVEYCGGSIGITVNILEMVLISNIFELEYINRG